MTSKTLSLTFKDITNDIEIDVSKINSYSLLFELIKSTFQLKEGDYDLYIRPNNTYLKNDNYKEEIIDNINNIQGILICENENLDTKINSILETIGVDIPENKIEDGDDEFFSNMDESKYVTESVLINPNQSKKKIPQKKPSKEKSKEIKKKEKIFINDECSLCKKKLEDVKYICSICDNVILCDKCEINHLHPLVKYKNLLFSENIQSIINYQNCKNKDLNGKQSFLQKIIGNKLNKIQIIPGLINNQIYMRPNQARIFQLKIINQSDINIKANQLFLILKNYDNLNIKYKSSLGSIEPKKGFLLNIEIKSNTDVKNYQITAEVYSSDFKFQSEALIINIIINNDDEDDQLNNRLKEYPDLFLIPKEQKKKIISIFDEQLSVKPPNQIYAILLKHKWNVEEALDDLTK